MVLSGLGVLIEPSAPRIVCADTHSTRVDRGGHDLRPTAPKTTSWEDIEADVRNFACPAAGSRGLLAPRRGMRSEPDVGEQLVELLCGMGLEATENVGEVGERIDVVMFTRPGEGIQHGRRPSAAVTAEEWSSSCTHPRRSAG